MRKWLIKKLGGYVEQDVVAEAKTINVTESFLGDFDFDTKYYNDMKESEKKAFASRIGVYNEDKYVQLLLNEMKRQFLFQMAEHSRDWDDIVRFKGAFSAINFIRAEMDQLSLLSKESKGEEFDKQEVI